MLHRILVPLDGSPFAEDALPVAFRLAARDDARVELVTVFEPPLPIVRAGGAPVRDPAFDRERHHEARTYLDTLLGRLDASDRNRVKTTLLEGSIVETLVDRIEAGAVELVVMTTHGRGGVSRAWLGSVADGLVRRAAVPVLLVRPLELEAAPTSVPAFARVLLPLDGSPEGEQIIEHAITVAGMKGVRYTLLRVLAPKEAPVGAGLARRGAPPAARAQRATVEALLEVKRDALRARQLTVRSQTVIDDDPAQGILRHAEESGADLIAMTTRSKGGLERMLLGSVADRVLRSSQRSMLLLNPTPAR